MAGSVALSAMHLNALKATVASARTLTSCSMMPTTCAVDVYLAWRCTWYEYAQCTWYEDVHYKVYLVWRCTLRGVLGMKMYTARCTWYEDVHCEVHLIWMCAWYKDVLDMKMYLAWGCTWYENVLGMNMFNVHGSMMHLE